MGREDQDQAKPSLNRDSQLLVGQCIARGELVDAGFFNFFQCTRTIRFSALSTLSRLKIFTVNQNEAQLRSPDGKHSLRIDLSEKRVKEETGKKAKVVEKTGLLNLKRIITMATAHAQSPTNIFFLEVYFISAQKLDFAELLKILSPLHGIKVISLPYELEKCYIRQLERFVHNNAETLAALKHLKDRQMAVPMKMRDKLVAINTSTLRSGTLQEEIDFFAYYTSEAVLPKELIAREDGILLRICVNRHNDPFRVIRRAASGVSSPREKITELHFSSSMHFDTSSAQTLLNALANSRKTFPNLKRLHFKLTMLDSWPSNFIGDEEGDSELALVSPMAAGSLLLANHTQAWLHGQTFPFYVSAKVCLEVDYMLKTGEDGQQILRNAMKQTEDAFGQRWQPLQWINSGTGVENATAQRGEMLGQNAEFHFKIKYKTLTLVNGRKEGVQFSYDFSL